MRDREHPHGGGVFAGVILILIGIAFLLEQFHLTTFNHIVRDWWPMIIVTLGVVRLFRGWRFWSGAWLIALGVWLEAVQLHWYGLTIDNSWPLLLIFIGAAMTLRAFGDSFRFGRRAP